ncbi:MAG: hypothetical protein H6658_04860 [Ardenticatenaceae bacterium]|nr:hypothetical protein [Ardenticatenaceae bacterium]
MFALILSFVTITVSRAETQNNEIGQPSDCLECHEDSVAAWEESTHAQTMVSEPFLQAWQEQGEPRACLQCHSTGFDAATGEYEAEGIACSTCHYIGEYSPDHPDQVMFTKSAVDSCGECHLETFADWQVSAHGDSEMSCINCHNPHTNSLKQDNVATLCQTCHTDEGHFYNMTKHAEAELLCTDCHLRVSENPMGDGHAQRHHTFEVDLDTCNECHGEDMHYPTESESGSSLLLSQANSTDSTLSLLTDSHQVELNPSSSSPLNLVLLATVIGLVFGLVGSPLFERWFRQAKEKTS